MKNQTPNQRLRLFLEKNKISMCRAAEFVGFNDSSISNFCRKGEIPKRAILAFAYVYHVNPAWITGESEEMYLVNSTELNEEEKEVVADFRFLDEEKKSEFKNYLRSLKEEANEDQLVDKGISQSEIARKLGISRQAVHKKLALKHVRRMVGGTVDPVQAAELWDRPDFSSMVELKRLNFMQGMVPSFGDWQSETKINIEVLRKVQGSERVEFAVKFNEDFPKLAIYKGMIGYCMAGRPTLTGDLSLIEYNRFDAKRVIAFGAYIKGIKNVAFSLYDGREYTGRVPIYLKEQEVRFIGVVVLFGEIDFKKLKKDPHNIQRKLMRKVGNLHESLESSLRKIQARRDFRGRGENSSQA